jgi:glucokinase
MMSKRLAIGIDVGATNIKITLGDEKGQILDKFSEKTEKNKDPESISNQLVKMIQSLQKGHLEAKTIVGIGIGSAGPLDLKKGGLMKPTNMPYDFVPLVEPLEDAFKLPTYLLNDCAVAVIGEKYFGAGKAQKNMAYITISTGIGGGVYVDDHLLIGKDGNAHEIGHFTIDNMGYLQCGCGKKGHWEAYCAGSSIPNFVRLLLEQKKPNELANSLLLKAVNKDLSKLTAKILYDTAKIGDTLSVGLVEDIGRLNAIGFACVIDAYDPSLITVGGAVALNNADLVIAPIKRYVCDHARNRLPEILLTPLGEYIVAHGALSMVFKHDDL